MRYRIEAGGKVLLETEDRRFAGDFLEMWNDPKVADPSIPQATLRTIFPGRGELN